MSHGVLDPSDLPNGTLWLALSRSPGIGVSITDVDGRLLYVNDTAMVLFSERSDVDYGGKTIADFHPPEFVRERLEMIRRVVEEKKPLAIRHLYHGRRIESTVWSIHDRLAPYDRVLVISHVTNLEIAIGVDTKAIETIHSEYIDLGPYNILSPRELEVFVMLGHGLSVPRTAAILHRSAKTIQRHKAAISKKLGLHGQAELVHFVTQMGLDLKDTRLKRFGR